jgi:hypothetical protein
MVANDTLEILVFEEIVEEINRIVKEEAPRYKVLIDYDPFKGT